MKKLFLMLFLLISNIASAEVVVDNDGIHICEHCVLGKAVGYKTQREAYMAAELDGLVKIAQAVYGDQGYDSVQTAVHSQLNYNNPSVETIKSYRNRVYLAGVREEKVECGYTDATQSEFVCAIVYVYPPKGSNLQQIMLDTVKYEFYQDYSKGFDASNPDQFKKPEDDSIWKKLDYNF